MVASSALSLLNCFSSNPSLLHTEFDKMALHRYERTWRVEETIDWLRVQAERSDGLSRYN